jgi:hypothetical protein
MDEREAFFQDLCDNAHDLIQSVSPEGRFLYVNRSWRETLGYSADEVPSLAVTDVIDPASLDHCMRVMQDLLGGRQVADIEAYFRTKEGRRVAVEGSASCRFVDGRPVSTRGVFRDVTERNRVEEELERLFVLAQDLLCVAGMDGFLQHVNPAFSRLLGYTEKELLSTPFLQLVHPDDRSRAEEALGRSYAGQAIMDVEVRAVGKDGVAHDVAWRSTPSLERRLIYAVGRDVTEGKRLRALLERRTRELARSNEELEQFAYAASHDLRAPLRGLANLLDWLEEDLGDRPPPKAGERIGQMRDRVRGMETLMEDLLRYSRADRELHEPTEVSLSALLGDLVELLAPPPAFRVRLEEPLPTLVTPRPPLEQVFRNLLTNAFRHHDGPRGEVVVRARERDECYEFVVADDGPGVPETERERVFQIFHKLPSAGEKEGSGLGLAIVRRAVERAGGRVWIEPNVPRGAAFHFTWPKAPPE